jgi:modulator of FtsH protease
MAKPSDVQQPLAATRLAARPGGHRAFGSAATIGRAAIFGQVMGLVACTLAFTTLGCWLGGAMGRGAAVGCLIGGCVCICVSSPAARRSETIAISTLFGAGLFLGLGLAPALHQYAQANPAAVWRAAGATALFIAVLGTSGYVIRHDLSAAYRALFLLLLGLLGFGVVAALLSIPHSSVAYAVLGLGIFGGYTVADFNRLHHTGVQDAVALAAVIFLDVLNVFLFMLRLLGGN